MSIHPPLRPTRIEEPDPQHVAIEWADGHRSLHGYRLLRFACACAFCRDEHTGKVLIKLEKIREDIHPRRIEPVGTYALRFHWSDGHATGLYSFEMLRRICECELCREASRAARDGDDAGPHACSCHT